MSAATTQTSERQPVLYLSHGAPPLADDTTWTGELAAWSSDLPRPSSVLIVSAHFCSPQREVELRGWGAM